MAIGGALLKGMIGGALRERAQNMAKTNVGKLVSREKRIMMGEPHPKAQLRETQPAIQPQQSLAPSIPSVDDAKGEGPKTFKTEKEAALRIKNTTIEVATLLKGSYVLQQERLKNKEDTRKLKKRSEAESGLEKGDKASKGKAKIPKLPGKGLVNTVWGFVSSLLFGTVLMKLLDWMPTLQKILPKVGAFLDWMVGAGIWIIDALGNIIDFGYKLVDSMNQWVTDVFGEEAGEKFTTFMTNVKDLIAGFLLWKVWGQKIFNAVIKNIKRFWRIGRAIITNAWKVVNFITGGAAGRIGGAITQGVSNIFTRATGGVFSRGLGSAGTRIGLKVFGKGGVQAFAGVMAKAKGIFGRVPIIGPIIVGIVSLLSGEPLGQALFKTFGTAIGEILGTFIPIPFIGTLLGGLIGGFAGDLLYHLIVKKDPAGAFNMLKDTVMGIFGFITKIPIIGDLIELLGKGGNVLWNFAKWTFFDALPWVVAKVGGIGKMMLEWLGAVFTRFNENFPAFNLPLMKFPLLPFWPFNNVMVDINWIMGKILGWIPWFKKWMNSEDQLMHFPDFSMFIPIIGAPFFIGHLGKSMFPGSFFEGWPSGVSGWANQLGNYLNEKYQKGQEKEKEMREEREKKGRGWWNPFGKKKDDKEIAKTESTDIGGVKESSGNILQRVNPLNWFKQDKKDPNQDRIDEILAGPWSKEAVDELHSLGVHGRKINFWARGRRHLTHYAGGGPGGIDTQGKFQATPDIARKQLKEAGMGEYFLGGYVDKDGIVHKGEHVIDIDSSIPEVSPMLLAINAASGYEGVMEAIKTYAPYEDLVDDVITIPSSGLPMEKSIPLRAGSSSPTNAAPQEVGMDPYEILYKGG